MASPPFDDEELINDCLMEAEQEDFYDDQDYMQMMLDEHEGLRPTSTPTTKDDTPRENHLQAQMPDNPPEEVKPLDPVQTEIETTGVPVEVSLDSTRAVKKNRASSGLYDFERYNGKRQWRSVSKTSDDKDKFEATQWKRRMNDATDRYNKLSDSMTSGNSFGQSRGKSSRYAPETQLVDFLNDTLYGPPNKPRSKRFRAPVRSKELPVEGKESIPVTISDGTRLHIPRVTSARANDGITRLEDFGLLGVPMSEILKRADRLEKKAIRKRRRAENEISLPRHNDMNVGDGQLWVDKHAPTHFSHLLSNEKVNREVLRTLRAWDPYVFKKDPPQRPEFFRKHSQDESHKSNEADSGRTEVSDTDSKRDSRPSAQKRVILLSGAPGVGKTTLAHIISKHAGYRPLEVNASDDRSANVLIERLSRAMESTTLQFGGKDDDMAGKPNCLILDEIDGVDAKSSVSALVDIIRADIPDKHAKGKKNKYLRRPIIFICNQKYSTALKPLLQYAVHFDVSPPTPNRLVSRLKSILSTENIAVVGGNSQLNQLVAETGGDIRSCLYTLQYASARAREILRRSRKDSVVDISPVLKSILNGNGAGLKDGRCDAVGTLTTIFQKKKAMQRKVSSEQAKKYQTIEHVLNTVEHFGDNSKALDSMFTNVISVSYSDPTLDKCWSAHEWLSSGDVYRSFKTAVAMNDTNEHQMMQRFHIPSSAAAIHLLCRVETKPNLNFSTRIMMDAVYKREGNSVLVHRFIEGLSPSLQNGVSKVTTEMLSYFLSLLSPNDLNRPVSSVEFLNKGERNEFDMHIKTLRALGLTYVPDSNSLSVSRTDEMRLEPAIDQLSYFQGVAPMKVNGRKEVPAILKMLLAKEVENEGIRSEKSNVTVPATDVTPPEKPMEEDKAAVPNSMETIKTNSQQNFLDIGAMKARAAKNARKASNVGLCKSKRLKLSNSGSGTPLDQTVRFKYKKGFTQAVRVPCSRSDILF